MRVSLLFNPISNTNNIKTNRSPVSNDARVQLSFKGDSFEKTNDPVEVLEDSLRKDLNRVFSEMKREKYDSVGFEIYKRDLYRQEMNYILKEYKKLDEMLSQFKGQHNTYNYEIFLNYLNGRMNMAADKGFNRIVGHDLLKHKLIDAFCMETILKDKLEQTDNMKKNKVPDIVFFYGPTGTGKTTFARALGEEAQTFIEEPVWTDLDALTPEKQLEVIKNLARKSLVNYNNSSDKKRTIIILNEVDSLIKKPSSSKNSANQNMIVEEFLKLAKDCAENYKCTLFLTTNEPQRIDERILDKEVMPVKIGLGTSDRDLLKSILEKKLAYYKISLDTETIMNKLYEVKGNREYSNSDIEGLVESVVQYYGEKPEIQDFLEEIDCGSNPGISSDDLKKFKVFKESQKNNIGEEWKELD